MGHNEMKKSTAEKSDHTGRHGHTCTCSGTCGDRCACKKGGSRSGDGHRHADIEPQADEH